MDPVNDFLVLDDFPPILQLDTQTNKETRKRKRTPNKKACSSCTKSKVKCDGEDPNPCSRCADRDVDCVYEEKGKRGPKKKIRKVVMKDFQLPIVLQRKLSNSSLERVEKKVNVLVGVSGSVAAIKVPEIVNLIAGMNYEVQVTNKLLGKTCIFQIVPSIRCVFTKNSLNFVKTTQVQDALPEKFDDFECYDDEADWRDWKKVGDPVVHIELRKWADVFLISPLSAHTMAKFANGLCDNLISNIFRAWDPKYPTILCPAMNTFMWNNPLTQNHLTTLKQNYSSTIVNPVSKKLACGDVGVGGLEKPDKIALSAMKEILTCTLQSICDETGYEPCHKPEKAPLIPVI